MIQDSARVSLHDGTQTTAIEVFPGRELLSLAHKRMTRAQVMDRIVEHKTDCISILLANGQKLTGSRDQKVAVMRNRNTSFKPLADVEIGDFLRGELAGMPVVVKVIGLAFDLRKEIRLVGFMLDHEKSFVAEGVLCR